MTELKLGKMTYEQLAEWREVKVHNIYKNFKKFSEELSEYCEFTRYKEGKKYAGIEITKIYKPVYIKKKSKDYERMKEFIPIHVDKHPKIITGVFAAIDYQNIYKDCKLTLKTLTMYAREILKEFYGDGKLIRYGTHGISKVVAGISFDHVPRTMTEEELKRRHELLEEFIYKPLRATIGNLNYEEETELVGELNDYTVQEEEVTKEVVQRACQESKERENKSYDFNWAYQEFRYACCDEFGGWPIKAKKCKNGEVWGNEDPK